ncbi:uncharacterized protein [Palaemon carinicauda]|uniref:uncharacterized protein n=1 Tax=Palaemon carinicauda TaxID=392227 RepID=UPI0035B5974A
MAEKMDAIVKERKPESDILKKIITKIKFGYLICILFYLVLSVTVIALTRLVEKSITRLENECKYDTTDTTKNQVLCNFNLVLKQVFIPRFNGNNIEYYKLSTTMDKDNTPAMNNSRSPYQSSVFSTSIDRKANTGNAIIHGKSLKPRTHYKNVMKHEIQNVTGSVSLQNMTSLVEETSLATLLNQYLTQPTTSCKRLARIGGRSCLGAYDGTKLVCMDNDVRPRPTNCLVYSFGVGNDFSFDSCMQDYGCEVHSFDHDNDHEIYDYRQGPHAFFHKARIGYKDGYFETCQQSQYGLHCEKSLRYYTIAKIRGILGHETRNVDYFKMDIEGSEWFVLGNIMHNSTLFQQTKQIALEIHLDGLNRQALQQGKHEMLRSYLSIFSDLEELGFSVAAYEENELQPHYSKVDGTTMSIYAEVLLLKRAQYNREKKLLHGLQTTTDQEKVDSGDELAFAELITHIVECQRANPGGIVFKLADLCLLYERRLSDFSSAAIKAAENVRKEMSQHKVQFTGTLKPELISEAIPDTLLELVSMIEHGPDIESQIENGVTDSDLAIAQLLVFHYHKKGAKYSSIWQKSIMPSHPLGQL